MVEKRITQQLFGLKKRGATRVIFYGAGAVMEVAYPLAIATLSKDFLLEFDGYPPEARARPITPGHLPPGTAMVSFEVDDIDGLDVEWRTAPQAIAAFPYNGRKAGVTVGAAGEWIELIELEK